MDKPQPVTADVSTSTFSDENPPLHENTAGGSIQKWSEHENVDDAENCCSMNQTLFLRTVVNEHRLQHHQSHHRHQPHYGYHPYTPHPHSYYAPHDYYPYHSYGSGDTRGYYHHNHHYHQPTPTDVPSYSYPYGYNHGKVTTDTPGSTNEYQQHHGFDSHSNEYDFTPYPYHGDSYGNNAPVQANPNKRNLINYDYTNSFYDQSGMNKTPQDQTLVYSRPAKKPRHKEKEHGMPRYPLSAYNFFFSEERHVVLAMLVESLPSSNEDAEVNVESPPGKNITSTIKEDVNNHGDVKVTMPTKFDSWEEELQYINTILSTRKLSKGKTEELHKKIKANSKRILDTLLEGDKVKKSHKKGHGKISFQVLSKLIGQRWRDVSDGDVKQYYFDLAKKDSERYHKQMKEYEEGKNREHELISFGAPIVPLHD